MNGKEGSEMIIDSILNDSDIEPETLAQWINESWTELSKHRLFCKGLYYSLMNQIYSRCQTGKQSFNEWIVNNNLDIA
jgi:hypothetical protein